MQNESFYTDDELLQLLKSGEELALTKIYKKLWHPLFLYAYNILNDKAACEDILQDAFLYIWEKRETLQVFSSLKGYLFTVTRHLIFHYIKFKRLRSELFRDLEEKLQTPTFELHLDEKEMSNKISNIVTHLPPRCREIYLLSREGFQSGKNIATILNISNKTVENQITKALRILREQLRNEV